jgi:ABC-type phosphate transport system permease subunit
MNTSQTMGIGTRLLNSMWAFWIVLLAGSMGLATAIYLVWLKGTI